jgi:hypothetical protein
LGVGAFERFDADLAVGYIAFSNDGTPQVEAECKPAGS